MSYIMRGLFGLKGSLTGRLLQERALHALEGSPTSNYAAIHCPGNGRWLVISKELLSQMTQPWVLQWIAIETPSEVQFVGPARPGLSEEQQTRTLELAYQDHRPPGAVMVWA